MLVRPIKYICVCVCHEGVVRGCFELLKCSEEISYFSLIFQRWLLEHYYFKVKYVFVRLLTFVLKLNLSTIDLTVVSLEKYNMKSDTSFCVHLFEFVLRKNSMCG
jgi:hypothetical protein